MGRSTEKVELMRTLHSVSYDPNRIKKSYVKSPFVQLFLVTRRESSGLGELKLSTTRSTVRTSVGKFKSNLDQPMAKNKFCHATKNINILIQGWAPGSPVQPEKTARIFQISGSGWTGQPGAHSCSYFSCKIRPRNFCISICYVIILGNPSVLS